MLPFTVPWAKYSSLGKTESMHSYHEFCCVSCYVKLFTGEMRIFLP